MVLASSIGFQFVTKFNRALVFPFPPIWYSFALCSVKSASSKKCSKMKRIDSKPANEETIATVKSEILDCRLCPRLVEWREKVAHEKVKRFQTECYWGKPVPSFGDQEAKLLIIGLAPAAHGSNRTGRMFTGDRSGDWLYRALYRAGFANQTKSLHRNDELELIECYITAVIHCAPPENKPLPEEIQNCRIYLQREIENLTQIRVVVALGRLAFDTAFASFGKKGLDKKSPGSSRHSESGKPGAPAKPKFSHGAECLLDDGVSLIASYHPSQQNTFTGRLTEEMLDAIFNRARTIIG
jgi:uracil-DNA glycosylase